MSLNLISNSAPYSTLRVDIYVCDIDMKSDAIHQPAETESHDARLAFLHLRTFALSQPQTEDFNITTAYRAAADKLAKPVLSRCCVRRLWLRAA